jgi:membrane fusion protein
VSDAQVDSKKAEELDAEAQRQDLDRAATVLARERQDILARIDMESRSFAIERQQLTRAQRELGQQAAEAEARRSATIVSPVDGRIGALDLKPGQAVRAGQSLATVIKGGESGEVFEVYLFAPSRSVGLLREQQIVHIRYDAFPYAKYGTYRGRIKSISAAPLSAAQVSPEIAPRLTQMEQSADVYYRIKVALDRQQISLANRRLELLSGMTLQADIIVERRRIWEWLVAPLVEASQSLEVLSGTGNVNQ